MWLVQAFSRLSRGVYHKQSVSSSALDKILCLSFVNCRHGLDIDAEQSDGWTVDFRASALPTSPGWGEPIGHRQPPPLQRAYWRPLPRAGGRRATRLSQDRGGLWVFVSLWGEGIMGGCGCFREVDGGFRSAEMSAEGAFGLPRRVEMLIVSFV